MINNKFFTFILALVAFTFILTGCYEPPTIQVNVPPPEVTVVVVDGDDDDSASVGDDDDSADRVEEEPRFHMEWMRPYGTNPVETIIGPDQGRALGTVVFSFRGGYQELHSFPLSVFFRADHDDVLSAFVPDTGVIWSGCQVEYGNFANIINLEVQDGPNWEVVLEEPVIHNPNVNKLTQVQFNVSCSLGEPTDANPDAYTIGYNMNSAVTVVNEAGVPVDTYTVDPNGKWLYNEGPDTFELYPGFFTVVETAGPTALWVTLDASSPTQDGYPIPGLVTLVFNFTAYGDDVLVSGLDLSVFSSDNAASYWNRCQVSYGLSVPGAIELYDTSDLSTPTGTFTPLSGGMDCTQAPSPAIVDGAELSTQIYVPEGQTMTFQVQIDMSSASAFVDDVVRVILENVTAYAESGGSLSIEGLPVQGGTLVL